MPGIDRRTAPQPKYGALVYKVSAGKPEVFQSDGHHEWVACIGGHMDGRSILVERGRPIIDLLPTSKPSSVTSVGTKEGRLKCKVEVMVRYRLIVLEGPSQSVRFYAPCDWTIGQILQHMIDRRLPKEELTEGR